MFESVLNYVLLLVIGVLSGLIVEFSSNEKRSVLSFLKICALVYVLQLAVTIAVFAIFFQFIPQQKSWMELLWIIIDSQWGDIVISFLSTIIAGGLLHKINMKRNAPKVFLWLLIFPVAVLSSVMYFFNSFKMIQHPEYSMPVEAISSIVNSRFNIYPFILSEDTLEEIGDGNEPISDEKPDSGGESGGQSQYEPPEEPTSFSGYVSAIISRDFTPGMDEKDYLRKAYNLFLAGRHDNNFHYIGVMWYYIHRNIDTYGEEWNLTERECLLNAIKAYQESEKIQGGNSALYYNISLVYIKLGDRILTREYINKALESDKREDGNLASHLSTYIEWIYWWSSFEDYALLRQDAENILKYQENLSIYVLYAASSIADNENIERAHELLCKADKYYQGKKAVIKILRCICADLLGKDETFLLPEIYELEDGEGLTNVEEIYLMRYLFNTNRYDELWGYISDVGSEEEGELDVGKAMLKATYYSRRPDRVSDDVDNVRLFLKQVSTALDNIEESEVQSEEKTLLLLSEVILTKCLDEEDSIDLDLQKYSSDKNSDIQNAICATAAFNGEKYAEAIEYCESFFTSEREYRYSSSDETVNPNETDSGEIFSLYSLTPQEATVLGYHVHLVYGASHYMYAMRSPDIRQNSEEWKEHMEEAEKECMAFKHTTKSLFYIGEKFEELQKNINIINGEELDVTEEKTPILR